MRLEHGMRVRASRERAWELLMDVPRVARCIPGSEEVAPAGPDRYRGAVRVSVGPVRLRLQGEITVVERDEAVGRATMRVDAKDPAVGGNVRADLHVEIREQGDMTDVKLVTEATLAGRIGDLGQPLIRRQADRIVADLARCLEQDLAGRG